MHQPERLARVELRFWSQVSARRAKRRAVKNIIHEAEPAPARADYLEILWVPGGTLGTGGRSDDQGRLDGRMVAG